MQVCAPLARVSPLPHALQTPRCVKPWRPCRVEKISSRQRDSTHLRVRSRHRPLPTCQLRWLLGPPTEPDASASCVHRAGMSCRSPDPDPERRTILKSRLRTHLLRAAASTEEDVKFRPAQHHHGRRSRACRFLSEGIFAQRNHSACGRSRARRDIPAKPLHAAQDPTT